MSLTYMEPYIKGDLGRLTKKLHKMCPAYYGILSAGMRAGLMMAIMSGKISEKEGLQMFGKLTKHVDMEEIDLGDDDTCCDHLEFEQLTSSETVPDEATGWN